MNLNYHNLDDKEQPPPVAYNLVYAPGWVTDGGWNVWSSWRGYGHFVLVRAASYPGG